MKVKTAKVPLPSLVLDWGLYPRHEVDGSHVMDLVRALEAGESIPPVIACETTGKVVDGFHRCKANERAFGAEAEVDVEWRQYENEAEMFLDSVRLNARHGQKLTKVDMTRCLLKAGDLHIDPEIIVGALAVTSEPDWDFLGDVAEALGLDWARALRDAIADGTLIDMGRVSSATGGLEPEPEVKPLTERTQEPLW